MPREKKVSRRTKKQISYLPKHSQRVYQKTHERALKHYRSPEKRKGRSKSAEKAAHKVAWAAPKRGTRGKGIAGMRKKSK
jgi:cation transport regulator ChaB